MPILGQTLTLSPVLETTFPASTNNDSTNPLISSSSTNHDSVTITPTIKAPLPAKRGHKLQVASACSNCKKAHLACDVSRPCKRCISLGKTDTCVDIEHKKRGRPKLQNKKSTTSTSASTMATNTFEVMRGTIQTPIFANDTSNDSHRPSPSSSEQPRALKQISFCHQPIESFHNSRQEIMEHKPADATQLTPIELTPSSPASVMSRTDSNMTAIDFEYANELPLSSFSPPSSPLSISSPSSSAATKVTLILSMELCCARISEDITKVWGYYPQELAHRSIYNFIATETISRLSQLHRRLLDNVVEGAARKDPSQAQHAPPPTERTTSDLFHKKTMDELTVMANGAQTLTDSLLIKTCSGSKEWYDICVHEGGGFGADMEDASTLTKLYIVMTCQKRNYTTSGNHQQQLQQYTHPLRSHSKQTPPRLQRPASTYRSILPLLSPVSATTATSQADRNPSTSRPWHRYAVYGNRPIRPAPHDLRRVSLPAHFANNSKLNTISFNNTLESPKINVAPTTTSQTDSNQKSPSATSIPPCTYFRPIAAASATISMSSSSSVTTPHLPSRLGNASFYNNKNNDHYPAPRHQQLQPSSPQEQQQPQQQLQPQKPPFTTIPYRYAAQTSTGPRETPAVTHPTTQYFLQTSSSTLNAAADHSRRSSSSSHPTTASPSEISSRKQGISIRSLLC